MTGTNLNPNSQSPRFLASTLNCRGRWGQLILLILFSTGLTACTSGVKMDTPPLSLRRLEKIVDANVPGGVVKRSVNGREFHSRFFDPQSLRPLEGSSSRDRARVTITILGDRRPYTLSIYAVRQRLAGNNRSYVDLGYDEVTSRRIADGLRLDLDESRKNRNLVDDFRPF